MKFKLFAAVLFLFAIVLGNSAYLRLTADPTFTMNDPSGLGVSTLVGESVLPMLSLILAAWCWQKSSVARPVAN